MTRITECFECGINEKESKLIQNPKGIVLCEKCNEKMNG